MGDSSKILRLRCSGALGYAWEQKKFSSLLPKTLRQSIQNENHFVRNQKSLFH